MEERALKMKEIENLQIESKRREQVACMKLFGLLTEFIEKQREVLKKKISPVMYDIFIRTIDLRNHVQRETLNSLTSSQTPSSEIIKIMINAYNAILKEMKRAFLKDCPAIADFPNIASTFNDPTTRAHMAKTDLWFSL